MADPIYREVPKGLYPDTDGRVRGSVTTPYSSPGGGGSYVGTQAPTYGNPDGKPIRSVTSPTSGK